MDLKGKKINFLGDSITEGTGVEKPENIFWNVIAKNTGADCRGYGIGGTRIARQKDSSPDTQWDRYFGSRVDEMNPDADIIVVFGGTNDFGHGDALLGAKDETEDEYTFIGALHMLCKRLKKRYPNTLIVFLTPTHRTSDITNTKDDGSTPATTLKGYSDIIKETVATYGFPVCDLFEIPEINPADPQLLNKYIPDGLHPNDNGHALIAEKVIRFLENIK